MRQVNETTSRFIRLLCNSWSSIEEIENADSTGSFRLDWLQATWELAVEGMLRQHVEGTFFLEPYGDGADANGASSRILEPTGLPTHRINCVPTASKNAIDVLNNVGVEFSETGMPCDRFVTLGDDGWYYERPPFDMVLVDQGEGEMVFKLSDLDILLVNS